MPAKKILLELPKDLNKSLNLHLIDLREIGVKITKADLCLKLIQIGLNNEKQ
jgi:hypothetical protein